MSTPVEPTLYHEWEALVGKAILRFGDIEVVSLRCLEFVPNDKIRESTAMLDFGKRVNVLIEILENRPSLDTNLSNILNGMKQARTLAITRNLIAHNPMMLAIFVNDDATTIVGGHSITSARSSKKSLQFDELKEFAAEVESLAADLWLAFSNYRKCTSHMFNVRQEAEKHDA